MCSSSPAQSAGGQGAALPQDEVFAAGTLASRIQ